MLAAGADPRIETDLGKRAAAYADENGHGRLAAALGRAERQADLGDVTDGDEGDGSGGENGVVGRTMWEWRDDALHRSFGEAVNVLAGGEGMCVLL